MDLALSPAWFSGFSEKTNLIREISSINGGSPGALKPGGGGSASWGLRRV